MLSESSDEDDWPEMDEGVLVDLAKTHSMVSPEKNRRPDDRNIDMWGQAGLEF